MKALVIGATGLIGNHITRALLAENIEVRAFSRGVTPGVNLEGLDVERFSGDVGDEGKLLRAARGCALVFHSAGYYPTHTFGTKEHIDKALKEIRGVLRAVSAHSIDRFVYTSSLTTIGRPHYFGELADETQEYDLIKNPPHPYFIVKYLMEEEVKKKSGDGFPAVITNPTGSFGAYEQKPPGLCLIPQLVRRKIPAYVDCKINAVSAFDVGRGHVLAAKKGNIGQRYILGGHNTMSGDLIRRICGLAGVKMPPFRFPLKVALVPSLVSEFFAHYIFSKTSPLPVLGLRFLQYGQHMNLSKATGELGYTVSPLDSCIIQAIEWFKKIGYC